MKLPSRKVLMFNAAAGLVIVGGFVSFVRTTFARPHFEVCSARYNRQLAMRLDRDGTPLTAQELQAVANGQDEGLLDNLTIAKFNEGPAKFAMGVKITEGSVEQRSETGAPGGISLPWTPSSLEQPKAACLSYNVFLPADFAYGGGGTLPGLFGTTINGQYGDVPQFGAHLAWHGDGAPKLYLNVKTPEAERAATYDSYDRELPRGRWVRVDQELVLNTPNQSDGIVRLWLDGKLEVEVKSAEIRPSGDMTIAGVSGDVFFGGSATKGKAPRDATIWLSAFELRWN